jgi:hypothetical protein
MIHTTELFEHFVLASWVDHVTAILIPNPTTLMQDYLSELSC